MEDMSPPPPVRRIVVDQAPTVVSSPGATNGRAPAAGLAGSRPRRQGVATQILEPRT
jgi:hypothetical protein